MIVAIDASRARSGGAKSHLVGIFSADFTPSNFNISEIHLWSYKSLLDKIPNHPWLIKHTNKYLEKSLFFQIMWQFFFLPREAKKASCDIMLYIDAASFINFHPCVVMSRDMLSFEKGEIQRYGFSKAWLRLHIIKYIQIWSLRKADGSIFLTKYASNIIQSFTGKLKQVQIIPHGISDTFRAVTPKKVLNNETINCVYVSDAFYHKHQWNVIAAISKLRNKGMPIVLSLVGAGSGIAKKKVDSAINTYDPNNEFVSVHKFVQHNEVPKYLEKAHIYIFASSCENMPNTLIEGMAAGMPIACSKRGPMPEILKDAGVFFNPENANSIADAIEKLIVNHSERLKFSRKAKELSVQYLWSRCANETFDFLSRFYSANFLTEC